MATPVVQFMDFTRGRFPIFQILRDGLIQRFGKNWSGLTLEGIAKMFE